MSCNGEGIFMSIKQCHEALASERRWAVLSSGDGAGERAFVLLGVRQMAGLVGVSIVVGEEGHQPSRRKEAPFKTRCLPRRLYAVQVSLSIHSAPASCRPPLAIRIQFPQFALCTLSYKLSTISSAHLTCTAPEAAVNATGRAANPALRLCSVPQIDQRLNWTEMVMDGVTGQHWVANLAYEPMREMTNPEKAMPVIHALSPASSHKCSECVRADLIHTCTVHPTFSPNHGGACLSCIMRRVNRLCNFYTPPFAPPALHSVAELVEILEQAFIAFGSTLERLMARWATETECVVVDQGQYERMQRYLGGIKLDNVRAEVATDPAVTGQAAPGVWQLPLSPSLAPGAAAPSAHSTRAKRARPVSTLLEEDDSRRPPEPKRSHQPTPAEEDEASGSSTPSPTPPVYAGSEQDPFE
ncbi:hypothetical protein KEM55_005871 [Ascosphaera atra]|nr:hypothetical protein KEM55_005871 [Ascosphaera atra]